MQVIHRKWVQCYISAAIWPFQNYNSQVCCMRLQSTVHIITSSPIVSVECYSLDPSEEVCCIDVVCSNWASCRYWTSIKINIPSLVQVRVSGSHSEVQHTRTTVSWPWMILVKVVSMSFYGCSFWCMLHFCIPQVNKNRSCGENLGRRLHTTLNNVALSLTTERTSWTKSRSPCQTCADFGN